MTRQPIETRTWIALAVALLLWASAFAGIRAGLVVYGPGEVALLRFGTASLVLGVYATATRMRLPAKADLGRILAAGLLGITIYHVCLNFGEVTVQAGAAALLISLSPIVTALLSTRFLGERLSVIGWTGICVSFAGGALIAFGEGGGGFSLDPGAGLILVATLSTSLYFITSKPLLERYSAIEFTTYAIWAGTAPMLVFAPTLAEQWAGIGDPATLAVLYLGVFPGAVAYVLWSHGLSKMPASRVSTFLYFQPVNATLIAWVWLREVPGALEIVGGIVSVLGVVIVNTRGMAASRSEALRAAEDASTLDATADVDEVDLAGGSA